jgi:hypothetical protein
MSAPKMAPTPLWSEIPLTQGKVAIVDVADYEWLSQWKWCANNQHGIWYAVRAKRPELIRMHRVILDAKAGQIVDHIDGNGLNNRRANIRLCTSHQNSMNMSRQTRGSSRFRGVAWQKTQNVWVARIRDGEKLLYLGRFSDEVKAALAYDAAAQRIFGEFARLNLPNGAEEQHE